MTENTLIDPVHNDDLPNVENAVAVGEDLSFQERWWRFETVVWTFFALVLIADVLGVFGRGWLANAQLRNQASGMTIHYERVERSDTPSLMVLHFDPDAVQNGAVHLFISESVVKQLGADRVIPQPAQSDVGDGGISYTFPVTGANPTVRFALEPMRPGIFRWTMQIPGRQQVGARVVVMP